MYNLYLYYIVQLPGQYGLVDQLLFHDQATVKEGEERSAVFQLFRNDSEYLIF